MSFFSFFRKKKYKTRQSSELIRYNFSDSQLGSLLDKAIIIFHENKDKDTNDIIAELDVITNNDKKCTDALYRFIPIILCRELFPEPEYPDYYSIYDGKNTFTEHLYSNNHMYNVFQPLIKEKYTNGLLSEDETFAILAHSSTFSALNEALHNGSKPGDLVMSPCIFYDL